MTMFLSMADCKSFKVVPSHVKLASLSNPVPVELPNAILLSGIETAPVTCESKADSVGRVASA